MAVIGARCAFMQMLVVLSLVLVGAALAKPTCPPPSDDNVGPSMDEMFYYSNLVVLGKVTQRFSKPKTPSVYTAQMEVHCVYKGGDQVPGQINITNAGSPGDACFNTSFEVGQSYLAYLHKHMDGRLTPAYPESPDTYKDELYIMCDVNITYPIGLTKNTATVTCEDEEYYDYGPEEEGEDGKSSCLPAFVPEKGPPYKPGKSEQEGDGEGGNNPNGSGFMRMSLLLLALIQAVMLVFS